MQIRTTNPALSDGVFEKESRLSRDANVMTLNGTVAKTGLLVILMLITAGISGSQMWGFLDQSRAERPGWIIGGLIGAALGATVLAFVTCFAPKWSAVTAPLYALLEGWVLGGISAVFEQRYAYIVLQAVALTVGVLVVLLALYVTRIVRATENFRLGVFAATGGIALVYLASFVLALFGVRVPYIHESGIIGIVFSLIVVVVAALNLVLDFDFIERGTERGAPKYMEWYAGFGLLVTLVWLYLEILNLLAKLRENSRSSSS